MRSDLVFAAMNHVPNRYLLVRLASKATRQFHRPNTHIKDTVNDVLYRFGCANPIPIRETPQDSIFHRIAA